MALNHHVLAKATTDAILQNFKSATWQYNGNCGSDFYRVGTSADFPSPDAAFYDPTNKRLASFEFKPATETKRGMLTGVGQSVAYLKRCDLAYLISPQIIDGFNMGDFLTELYQTQFKDKVPVGLIVYDNNNPTKLTLAHNVSTLNSTKGSQSHTPASDRYWAKHQDMPVELFHLLLHYYYLKKVGVIDGDAFVSCWKERMIPQNILTDFTPQPVKDIMGNPIKTLGGRKNLVYLEKKIALIKKQAAPNEWASMVSEDIDSSCTGDNAYTAVRKNLVTFLKHMQVIDSEGSLTDSGFKLYHLGLANGPSSKIFVDYFTREVLTTGHHLDLLLDLDSVSQKNPGENFKQLRILMESEYEASGRIKRNAKRVAGTKSKTPFLKYEQILWRALGLIDSQNRIQWKKVTEICSLPEI
ncbi:MAG: hypothetical protein E7498_07710 [Ruminococcus sp.]|nr:hypothetical protein [Ruminococcus sp.]